jgi:hypothetical protein
MTEADIDDAFQEGARLQRWTVLMVLLDDEAAEAAMGKLSAEFLQAIRERFEHVLARLPSRATQRMALA